MNRKYIFIPKADDKLDAIEGLKVSTDFDNNLKPKFDADSSYTLSETKNKKSRSAYILSINREYDNKEVWIVDKINELYEKLTEHFHGEKASLVLAIHWGGIEEERDGKSKCDEITENLDITIRKNIILTHYSGTSYDSDVIDKVKTDGSGLDKVIEKIKKRIDKDVYVTCAQIFYDLKEDLLHRLFSLSWDQTLKNDQIKEIRKNVEEVLKKKDKELKSKNAEIGDDILQLISDKISVLFKSLEGQQPPKSKKCNKALQDIRANINTLIDAQLKKANKKAIYEQR